MLTGHSHEKVFEIAPLNHTVDEVQTKVRQPFFNFLICPSHRYNVLKEWVHDVKWDQLICQQNSYTVLQRCTVFVFCHANLRTTGIREAALGIDVLPRATKP
jgi:hypothetical protein